MRVQTGSVLMKFAIIREMGGGGGSMKISRARDTSDSATRYFVMMATLARTHTHARAHTQVVKVLLDKGVSPDAVNNARSSGLHLAAAAGHTAVVQVWGKSASTCAHARTRARARSLPCVGQALVKAGARLDLRNAASATALHLAAQVRLIIEWVGLGVSERECTSPPRCVSVFRARAGLGACLRV